MVMWQKGGQLNLCSCCVSTIKQAGGARFLTQCKSLCHFILNHRLNEKDVIAFIEQYWWNLTLHPQYILLQSRKEGKRALSFDAKYGVCTFWLRWLWSNILVLKLSNKYYKIFTSNQSAVQKVKNFDKILKLVFQKAKIGRWLILRMTLRVRASFAIVSATW